MHIILSLKTKYAYKICENTLAQELKMSNGVPYCKQSRHVAGAVSCQSATEDHDCPMCVKLRDLNR